jgi:hypothetical protein
MKWLMLPAAVAVVVPATGVAEAKPATSAHARAYERAYREVAHKLGPRAPGRNIVKNGVRSGRHPDDGETLSSLAVLARMLAPSPSPAAATSSASTTATTAATPSAGSAGGSSGSLPACASESGSNYSTGADNTNASSGATGRYQITPSTAAAYGCSLGSAGGQDACAQTIYEHQGAGAWVGCGG